MLTVVIEPLPPSNGVGIVAYESRYISALCSAYKSPSAYKAYMEIIRIEWLWGGESEGFFRGVDAAAGPDGNSQWVDAIAHKNKVEPSTVYCSRFLTAAPFLVQQCYNIDHIAADIFHQWSNLYKRTKRCAFLVPAVLYIQPILFQP